MKVTQIIATNTQIEIVIPELPILTHVYAQARLPLVTGDVRRKHHGRIVQVTDKKKKDRVIFDRFAGDIDLLLCRFEVDVEGKTLDGVRYVTDIAPECSASAPTPFEVKRPVGTWVTAIPEDIDYLGMGCMMTEINSPWIQTVTPTEQDISHVFCGKTYYFDKPTMDLYDRLMQPCIDRGIPCLIRAINRFSYRLKGSDDTLTSIIGHPGYEPTGFNEQMSAFNLRTEDGFWMYCAFIDFLCARYMDKASPLYCSDVMDIGNEINAQEVWHNTGAMTCADFMEEYTVSLRLAHLIARKYNAGSRVNISLDHYFATALKEGNEHYYPGRACLAYLADYCHRDGDFDWGIAAHPYPENLTKPDFYNDTTATFDWNTPRITMRNLEMLQGLVELPEFLYRGKTRTVVCDEQGFHTDYNDPESENKGAYAFVLLMEKLQRCPNITWFLINRYADMPLGDESELHLGLRYEKGYADDMHLLINPGDYKKICYAMRAFGTAEWQRWIDEARAYIGAELYDSLLAPVMSKDQVNIDSWKQ
ncbi:MAG: hypothetical protein IJW70_07495 [Clostridia bacterium]|nr:hypothetical protein [Clostridia bacterium]